ncbi:hypothetical protein MRX96_041777 [Rhipicephalus microplus]
MSQATLSVLTSRPIRPVASTAVAASDASNTTKLREKPASIAAASTCGRLVDYVSVRVGQQGSRKIVQGMMVGRGVSASRKREPCNRYRTATLSPPSLLNKLWLSRHAINGSRWLWFEKEVQQ